MAKLFQFGLRALAFFLLICLAFRIAFFTHLFSDHAGIALTQEEVAQAHHAVTGDVKRPPTIPRIIHQIYHNWTDPSNEDLPSDWKETRKSCLDFNENWEHRVSTLFGKCEVTLSRSNTC